VDGFFGEFAGDEVGKAVLEFCEEGEDGDLD
jgi:hypothetical protein